MTLKELIGVFRFEADDEEKPYYWSDETLTRYANEAEKQAAKRSHFLRTLEEPEFTRYTVRTNKPLVKLDPKILRVYHADLHVFDEDGNLSRVEPLCRITRTDMEIQNQTRWRQDTGEPTHYIPDMKKGWLRLFRIPLSDHKLELEVARLPKKQMCEDEDSPEIPEEYHEDLVQWMLFRAYFTHEADKADDSSHTPKAADHLSRFEEVFGPVRTAEDEDIADLSQVRRTSKFH